MSITTPLQPTDPRRLGSYTLLWRLGGGGMGVVYLGEAPDERLVAIKVIRPELADDPMFLARFRQEVEAASRVAGFCTARVIDADLEAAQPWFVTEYVDGPTLQQAVKRSGPLSDQPLFTFALGVAEALDAIHEAGVIHRDLKPSNVLLARNAPKVIDFGIARAKDAAQLTQTGKLIGTVSWLAPEQLRSDRASPLSDVFAWGGLIAFAATGRPPFGAGPPEVVVHRILNEQADLDGLESELRALVEQSLAKQPEQRPSARALLARLLGAGTRKADAAVMASQVVKDTWTGSDAWQEEAESTPSTPAMPEQPEAAPVRPSPVPAANPARPFQAPVGAPARPTQAPTAALAGWHAAGVGRSAQVRWDTDRPAARQQPAAASAPRQPRVAPPIWVPPGGTAPPADPAAPASSARPAGSAPPVSTTPPGGSAPPAGGAPPAMRVPEREAEPATQPREPGSRRVLADWLPGGIVRDLVLVLVFAAVMVATLPDVRPVAGSRLPPALPLVVAGAALLGIRRALPGLALGMLGSGIAVHGDPLAFLDRPLTLAGYCFLGLVVLLVGQLAAGGRRLRPVRLLLALAVGYGLVHVGMAVAVWISQARAVRIGL
jgi:eukaryotic-like serine/threonine-protein kinase